MGMPGADEFYTRDLYLQGEEVFGTQKHKANLPLGADEESHQSDRVIFSHLWYSSRRPRSSTNPSPIIDEDDSVPNDEVPPSMASSSLFTSTRETL